MALPPFIRIRAPAIAASGCTVETMPCWAMTSERVCGTHPSDRSPRTAAQDGAEGDSLHICTGGESARAAVAADKPHAAPNKISAQFNNFRMSANSLTYVGFLVAVIP